MTIKLPYHYCKYLGCSLSRLKLILSRHWPIVSLTLTVWAIIFATYKDYGITWDEIYHLENGKTYLQFLKSFYNNSFIYSRFRESIESVTTRGFLTEAIIWQLMQLTHNLSMQAYHFFLAIFASFSLFLIYFCSYLLTKSRYLSFVSALILITSPRFYGHIFNNSKDIQNLSLVLVVTLLAIIYFSRRTSWPLWLSIGLVSGVGISQRIAMANIFFVFLASCWIFRSKIPAPTIKSLFAIISATILATYLFSPYLLLHPIGGLLTMIQTSLYFPWNGQVLYFGKFISAHNLPWHYLPVWMAITIPLLTLGLGLLGVFMLGTRLVKKEISPSQFFILSSLVFPILLVCITRPTIYDGWRHFAFLSVPLVLLAVLALEQLTNNFQLFHNKSIVTIAIVWQAVLIINSMIRLHPYQYIYFNSLVGGLRGAYGQFETDYWGQSFKEAVEWVKSDSQGQPVSINACAFAPQSSYFFAPNMTWAGDPNQADYVICYTRNNEHLKYLKGEIVHIVSRDSVALNIIRANHPHASTTAIQ